MGLFSKIKKGLLKTKQQMVSKIELLLNSFTKIDEDLFEQLEETLIMSDVGVETSIAICEELRKKIKERGITDPSEIMHIIHEIVAQMMGDDIKLDLSTTPSVIMVIGVNGAGKTTTIGKLCYKLKKDGKKVLVAAADTFRAAAIDQLQVWTDRAGVDIIKHSEGSDAAAVVFDAVTAAKARKCDVVVIDTAGRLHNKKNLMEELAKINRIITQQAQDCSREILLVLDATTGQNAVNQAKLFKEVADITGIVLTKLDGTAKGGIVISIKNELNIPVKLIGLGEKIDDLQEFDSADFVNALFDDDVLSSEEHEYEDDQDSEDDSAIGKEKEDEDLISEIKADEEAADEAVQTEAMEETTDEAVQTETVEETTGNDNHSQDKAKHVNHQRYMDVPVYNQYECDADDIIKEAFSDTSSVTDTTEDVDMAEIENESEENDEKKKKFGFGWFKNKKKKNKDKK